MKKRIIHIIKFVALITVVLFVVGKLYTYSSLYKDKLETISGYHQFNDATNGLDIYDLIGYREGDFETTTSFKLPQNQSTWIKIARNSFEYEQMNYVIIEQTQIDYFEWYIVENGSIIYADTGGIKFPFFERKEPFNKWVLDATNGDKLNSELYLKIVNSKSIFVDLKYGTYREIILNQSLISNFFGLLVGIFIVMAFYNAFIYFSIKERSYLIYVFHTILVCLTQLSIFGYGYNYLWPDFPGFQNISVELFSALVSIVGLEFLKEFLETKKNATIINKIVNGWIIGYVFIAILSIVANPLAYQILLITQPIVAIFVISSAAIIFFRGYRPAKFYLISWGVLMLGLTIYAMAEQGIIGRNTITTLMMPIGSALEVILLSIALADNINILKKSRELAIEHSLELETEKAQLIIQQNVELEGKVLLRTIELEEANEVLEDKNKELSDAYTDLKNTQSQLVHAEKMSSLGQLTAGIAHEINNPINFVSSNILPLKRDIADIISIFEQTENFVGGKLDPNDFKEIQELKEQFDYDYILKEIDQLLDGMSDGANRTVEIIRGLKLFSRVDEDDLKRVNLEDGINSTLILLNSAVKHQVDLVKNFGEIPEVECYGGKMNQVFMNIISNAIQAIRDTGMEDGKIIITTSQENDLVHISIADNGPGMTEEIKQKLFEPFFTTKPVGEGTGLGLSIVYKIIDKINGKIEVNTEPGKGTEFIITLPITNTTKD